MKQRLLRREDVIKVLNVLQKEHPVSVLGRSLEAGGQLWTKMVDYDEFVAELNEWVYKTEGGVT